MIQPLSPAFCGVFVYLPNDWSPLALHNALYKWGVIMDRDLYRRQRERERQAAQSRRAQESEPRASSVERARQDQFYEAVPASAQPLYGPAYTRAEPVALDPEIARPDRASRVVAVILYTGEVLLLARVLFRALSANSASGLVQFVYNVTAPLVTPFVGIFALPVRPALEVATITAMIVYAAIGYLVVAAIRAVRGRRMRDL